MQQETFCLQEDDFYKSLDLIGYEEQRRRFGEGYRRIGETMKVNEDIYGFAFASFVREDLILEILDIRTGEISIPEEESE